MSQPLRPKDLARLPRGFEDKSADHCLRVEDMCKTIASVYTHFGFDYLETPFIEYADALGKFLPDQDRPNAGVFSFADDDEQWLSLRYDLTAPLARHVAENYDHLAKPYRTYRAGYVFRNEKPGPGRFRQFMQFDADTVGTASSFADGEMCMMAAQAMKALGLKSGDFVVRIFNRKIIDGLLDSLGLDKEKDAGRRLQVLRALDKRDRLGDEGVALLLGAGRLDESGDFTKGAGLDAQSIAKLLAFVAPSVSQTHDEALTQMAASVGTHEEALAGIEELRSMAKLFATEALNVDDYVFDPSVVRGLEYYTGPVFEIELTAEVKNENGQMVRFGAVGGGGRYDGLVSRFRGETIGATGISIGVSRLLAALNLLQGSAKSQKLGPVVVMVMDKEYVHESFEIAALLRKNGIRAEAYSGTAGMKPQLKYADRRNAPCAIMVGSNEREAGIVTIKDLIVGREIAEQITDNAEWKAAKAGQMSVERSKLVQSVQEILSRHQSS